jgi:hypothetical protein
VTTRVVSAAVDTARLESKRYGRQNHSLGTVWLLAVLPLVCDFPQIKVFNELFVKVCGLIGVTGLNSTFCGKKMTCSEVKQLVSGCPDQ